MADATTLYAIDNSQDYNVVAQTCCNRIVVQENYNSVTPPTVDLLQKMPSTAASAVNIVKGTAAIYTPLSRRASGSVPYFLPGEVVGTIRTVSGSATVQQIESSQV